MWSYSNKSERWVYNSVKKYVYELTAEEVMDKCKNETECESCKLGYLVNGHILCARDIMEDKPIGLKALFDYLLQEIEV